MTDSLPRGNHQRGRLSRIIDHVVVLRRCCVAIGIPAQRHCPSRTVTWRPDPARMTLHSNAKYPTNRSTRLATKEQHLMCMPMVAVALAQAGH